MNIDTANDLIKNFTDSDWTCGVNKMIYNNDFDFEIRLENKVTRKEDEILKDASFDDVFSKYNPDYIYTTHLYYKNIKLNILTPTLLCIKNNYIPIPVAANMITDFYKNEVNIAKKFSSNISSVNSILQGCNLNYQ